MSTVDIRKTMDVDPTIQLSNGNRVRIPKWSIRKAIEMSSTIARIVERFFRNLEKNGDGSKEVSVADFIAAIPEMLTGNLSDLTYVIVESLTLPDGKKQIEEDALLDSLDMDDFCDLIGGILDRNFGENSMGKWKKIMKKIPMLGGEPSQG